jgi:hypothetical protein
MWFSFSSWCNWLHANSHFETKECFHNCKLFFLQVKVMEFATTSNGWSSKVVSKCICWHAKFYERFPKFIIVKPLLKKINSSLFNSKDGFQNRMSITSWGVRVTHFYLGSWSFKSKQQIWSTLFWKLSSTYNCIGGGMSWKMCLRFWRRHSKSCYLKVTCMFFSFLILFHVVTCCKIWY